jgi:hypothetical protein
MKYKKNIKLYEEYTSSVETKPNVKPQTAPKVSPLSPTVPKVFPNPKNLEEILKKIVARYNDLTKKEE